MILKIWPTKPSGVQQARPILPPGRQTRASSRAAWGWSGANITPKVETTTSKDASAKGKRFGVGLLEVDLPALGRGAQAAAFEQRGNVVGAGDASTATGGGEGDVPVARGDIEDLGPAAEIERFAQQLAGELQGGAEDGIVSAGPGYLLPGLDGFEIGVA